MWMWGIDWMDLVRVAMACFRFCERVFRRFGGSGLRPVNVRRQDAPSGTGSRDGGEIQAQFPGQTAGRRSGAHRAFRSGCRTLRGSVRGLGGRFRGNYLGLWLQLGDGGFKRGLQFRFVAGDIGQHGFHRCGFTFLDGDYLEEAVAGGLDLGIGLLGFDLDHGFTLGDGVAFLLEPSHDGPFFHGDGQLRQLDGLHVTSIQTRPDHP